MSKKQIILIGGGGHCKSCIDVLESMNEYEIAGIIDAKEKIGDSILGYKIIGCDDDLKSLRKKYDYALITVGQIKSTMIRVKLFHLLKELEYILPVIIASSAYVSKHASIDEGTIIMHQAMVNADVKIGKNCIINTKALVEHDTFVGDFCHISTNAILNGNVVVGNKCFIGSASVIRNGISITNHAIISMGSIVLKNVNDSEVYLNSSKKI